MNSDGTNQTRLTNNTNSDSYPSWGGGGLKGEFIFPDIPWTVKDSWAYTDLFSKVQSMGRMLNTGFAQGVVGSVDLDSLFAVYSVFIESRLMAERPYFEAKSLYDNVDLVGSLRSVKKAIVYAKIATVAWDEFMKTWDQEKEKIRTLWNKHADFALPEVFREFSEIEWMGNTAEDAVEFLKITVKTGEDVTRLSKIMEKKGGYAGLATRIVLLDLKHLAFWIESEDPKANLFELESKIHELELNIKIALGLL